MQRLSYCRGFLTTPYAGTLAPHLTIKRTVYFSNTTVYYNLDPTISYNHVQRSEPGELTPNPTFTEVFLLHETIIFQYSRVQ